MPDFGRLSVHVRGAWIPVGADVSVSVADTAAAERQSVVSGFVPVRIHVRYHTSAFALDATLRFEVNVPAGAAIDVELPTPELDRLGLFIDATRQDLVLGPSPTRWVPGGTGPRP